MSNHKKPESGFSLKNVFFPTGDQPQAIDNLTRGVRAGIKNRVLLGVTGSGKTFTIANMIANIQMPVLVISHNKTLAAQLYQEFKEFFPNNAVSYFVSYYDYYQPEAYIPQTDTYIEKETEINEEIDKLRLAATTNILTRRDVIVVASVSCIYNIGSPKEYGHFILELKSGQKITRQEISKRLVDLQYSRNDMDLRRGNFRVRGEIVDLCPAYQDTAVRVILKEGKIGLIENLDPLTGKSLGETNYALIYPAKHYMTDPGVYNQVFGRIRHDLDKQVDILQKQGKVLAAARIKQRVEYDLEMIGEVGYVNGIENYSRYFDGRQPGDPPYTLLDYFRESYGPDKWLLVIDESHMTVPQIRGMYNGDRSRKQTLIDFGFRLPSALDNRPLRFDEFMRITPSTIFVSATPDDWELGLARDAAHKFEEDGVVEQLVRPTGLVDPEITIRPASGQIADLIVEIEKQVASKQRVLVTTLTKKTAEDLTEYLKERRIKVTYLHSDIETLKRIGIISDLRKGNYDVIVGVNLLREGLDLPEVALVAILDADKEGFLRSRTSLIQTMGRASRHINGQVILYADKMTGSINKAVAEVDRRRLTQLKYNETHGITAIGITKPVRDLLVAPEADVEPSQIQYKPQILTDTEIESMTPYDRKKMVVRLQNRMNVASRELLFEEAILLRDMIQKLKKN